jgi:hypothetical protein
MLIISLLLLTTQSVLAHEGPTCKEAARRSNYTSVRAQQLCGSGSSPIPIYCADLGGTSGYTVDFSVALCKSATSCGPMICANEAQRLSLPRIAHSDSAPGPSRQDQ